MPNIRFIGESIEVCYDHGIMKLKSPPCPDRFYWRSTQYTVTQLVQQWSDFSRKGRMKRNMSEAHRIKAERTGSWGVGRFFFRVKVNTGQDFTIYYDRSPQSAQKDRSWMLFQENLDSSNISEQ
ncbi:MAG TPA: hypothetical protein DCK95_05330 [Anaerolineaceae bacterium]|uniref:DUF6504 domain-containing protein n=1 Tax=Anaerolinea thermophila TaxID=167964 RepID=A0A101FYP9_9CHLR|nr:MAG: hypothetical protein XD73_0280 [Anaerolinea thermophila]HAF61728.1 hypothetical protein [Anaerolineaceae bacterium]